MRIRGGLLCLLCLFSVTRAQETDEATENPTENGDQAGIATGSAESTGAAAETTTRETETTTATQTNTVAPTEKETEATTKMSTARPTTAEMTTTTLSPKPDEDGTKTIPAADSQVMNNETSTSTTQVPETTTKASAGSFTISVATVVFGVCLAAF